MKKKKYIFFIILFLIFICSTNFAIDMNLSSEENAINESSNVNLSDMLLDNENTEVENIENTSTQDIIQNPVPKTTNSNSALSIESITSIILIAIGIVLILLAIAILIRCK